MNRVFVRDDASALGEKPTPKAGFSPSVRLDLIAIAIPVIVGAILAAIELNTRSFWLDEGATFSIASQHGSALWHGIRRDGGNMLAYYLLIHFVIAWFGHAAWVLRLPSLVATAVTGGLVSALALRLFSDRRMATLSGLLAVVSIGIIYWGQNARGYALLIALSVGSFLALTAILQTPPGRAAPRGAIAAYVLTTLAGLYIGYDFALLIPAQLALLLLFRDRARLVIGCLALVLVLCVPLLVLAADRGSGQLFWVGPLSLSIAKDAAATMFSSGTPDFHRTSTSLATEILTALALLAAVGLAGRQALPALRQALSFKRKPLGPPHDSWRLLLVLSWALIPGVLSLVLYVAGEPVELPRVTILWMPALALLLAWLLLRSGLRPVFSVAGIAILLALRLLQIVPSYGVSPEPWNAVTAHVLNTASAGKPACVVFYPTDGRGPFDYYLRSSGRQQGDPAPSLTPILPSLAWVTVRPFVERYSTPDAAQVSAIAARCPRLWLISSHRGAENGTAQSQLRFKRYQQLARGFGRLYPHTSERSFGWSSTIYVRLYSGSAH